jgi:hypothetical protein
MNLSNISLRNYAYVANAYPELSMRIDSLSFYHHQIAAPLDNRDEGKGLCLKFQARLTSG